MPEAEPFIAIGAGNGFPECLSSVDVSDCDFWTTLGGTNKDNVDSLTPDQLEANKKLSLENAMKLYWNAYSVSGSATATREATASVSDLIIDVEPKKRVCGVQGVGDPDYDISVMAESQYSMYPEVQRFYNGPTDNEDNFVGIGYDVVPDNPNAFARAGIFYRAHVFTRVGRCSIHLVGALTSNIFDWSSSSQKTEKDVAYVEVNGIHFVAFVQATYRIGPDITSSSTLSVTNSDISASFTVSYDGNPDHAIGACSFTLPECFDFYTYP